MLMSNQNYTYEMLRSELTWVVGEDYVKTDDSDKLGHSIDYYWVPELWHDRGQKGTVPDFIVHPGSAREVSEILKLANNYGIPVIPWGGGSGSQGGALPIYGGIIMDMKRMNKVLSIDPVSMTATVEVGINTQHLEWAVQKAGYSTMHFPASIACATLGGFIAHRGTGVLSTKYGKMEDMIMSMEVVTPTGEIINTLPVPRHASGPDLTQLFLGSEGTLGVVTKATMKIHPIPESRKFHAFLFKNMHEAMAAGAKIMTSRLHPCVIRLYDEPETAKLIKRVLGIDKQGAYLVFGFDGPEKMVDLEMEQASTIAMEQKPEDLGSEMGEAWWEHRYKFFYPPYMFQLPQAFGTLDTVATFSNIENVYWAMKNTVKENFPQATFIGHFSHWYEWGCMLYARFIIDNPPQDPHEAIALYNKIWDMAIRAAIKEGGVINEHHGVGLKLGRMMKDLYGPAFKILQDIKQVLDPNNIMNPGKMGFKGAR
ncbi:MAG: Alkylglycerone-phosphate synthase [Candidatus Uhrbacteria bacterium GW2011_GWF2_39_13]|uniref:Alkylglycerone-phosphate synthase n=1 Tax=Candidatus Uhrbacteria bacterium GW2011_GWF2_39_13 TaxID=1618995 RepID=A0A0G0MWB4_9BACT|nr:MAG: Alkylglycerone-phosphate synthase [Candidatus Uhrbacteria bacterium GW2011_GWF2_39_13]